LGWYISEGSASIEKPSANSNQKNPNYRICITQKEATLIVALVKRMGLPYSLKKSRDCQTVSLINRPLYRYIEQNAGIGSYNKHIPKDFFQLDATHLSSLLKTLMLGDGSQSKKGQRRYTTVSSQLAEDVQRLCLHLGLKSRIFNEAPSARFSQKGIYRVSIFSPRWTSGLYKHNIRKSPYVGKVYCVTVAENHTVLAGRNNKFEFIGQSGTWGVMLQVQKAEGSAFAPSFNSAWGAEVENNVHVEVCRFCLDNGIMPLYIMTDGVGTDVDLKIESSKEMGKWKLDAVTPALVMGSGIIALKDKVGKGAFSLHYDSLMETIKAHPEYDTIHIEADGFVSMGEAIENKCIARLGETEVDIRAIKLNSDLKRCYIREPKNFGELITNTYPSIPWDVSMFLGD
jgi:hypothetical protein